MLNQFVFSVNIVLPIFLLISLGYVLRRREFLTEKFIDIGNKLMFYILLPTTLFKSGYATNLSELDSARFAIFAVATVVVSWGAVWAAGTFFIKDKKVLGSFVQGSFRANTVFVGLPLMRNLAGDAGLARFALILAMAMPLYNICSIITLNACGGTEEKVRIKPALLAILKNPLIIAVVIGVSFSFFEITLPVAIERALSDLSNMTSPMTLICLGAGITFLGFNEKFKFAVVASAVKVIVLPIAFTAAAFAFGFRGLDLAAFMVLGGVPTAIVGHVMAVQMGCDTYTSSTTILVSTLLSAVTLTMFIYFLIATGLFIG